MRIIYPLLIAATLVSACGGPKLSPEQKEKRAANAAVTKAAKDMAKTVTIDGKSFSVAHVVDRNYALVDMVGTPVPYFAKDVEAASRAATGCGGTFSPGILAYLGGDITTADLGAIRAKVSSGFDGWIVKLKC